MGELVPSERRIDRAALERIIQRAAELQTREREIGDGLTEAELLELGQEVGIQPAHLRRALTEERTRALVGDQRGAFVWLTGPRRVGASRVIAGEASRVDAALQRWMEEGELMQVKRRFPDATSWERKEGAFASLKRSLGVGGRKYLLARAREVVGRVIRIDDRQCHVQLIADLSNTYTEHVVGSAAFLGGGGATTTLALVLGVMAPVAFVPAVVSAPIAFGIARSRRSQLERVQVALEQVLDRLEHGDIEVEHKLAGPTSRAVSRIAEEIRRNLGV